MTSVNAAPVLLAVAHGTRSTAGQAQLRAFAAAVARRRPGLDVRLTYVDVQQPRVAQAAARLDRPGVVVPFLLTSGYHVRVDIAAGIRGLDAVATAPLGPDQRIVDLLAARLTAAGPADAVVLAAAGSSDARSRADVAAVAAALPAPVHVAYAATSTPRVPDVLADLRAAGARRVVVLAYLLADGLFYRSLHKCGADVVTAPLIDDPAMVELALARYDAAVPAPALGR